MFGYSYGQKQESLSLKWSPNSQIISDDSNCSHTSMEISRINSNRSQSPGPHRDDIGDVIDQFQLPYTQNAGLAWDGEYIWGVCRANPCRLYCIDPEDFNVIEDYAIRNEDAIGMTYDPVEGVFWVCEHHAGNDPSIAHQYDREGNHVGQVQLPRGGHHGLCTDGQFFYSNSENSQDNQMTYKLAPDGEVLGQGPNLQALLDHGRCVSIEYVRAHDEGHFWVMAVRYIAQVRIDFDNNRAEIIRAFNSNNADYPHQGVAHDGYNLWACGSWRERNCYVYDDGLEETYGVLELGNEAVEFGPVPSGQPCDRLLTICNAAEQQDELHVLHFVLTDLGDDPDWLEFGQEEGVVEAGGEVEVTLTAVTEGLELGEYERTVLLETNDPDCREVEIPVHIFVVEGFGQLAGVVTDDSEGTPLQGALVSIPEFAFETQSDENGEYVFEDIPAWNYDMLVTMEDFLPMWRMDVDVDPDENEVQDFALLHSVFDPDPDSFEPTMPPDEVNELSLLIENPGNGTLTWSMDRVFQGGGNIEPWEYRLDFAAGDSVEDARMAGIEFVEGCFYLAGGANRADMSLIYIFDRDGNYLDQFPQFAESRYGMRDLAYDGSLLWGIDGNTIYGFTTDGELRHELDSPVNSARYIAYDPIREALWVSSVTTDIEGINLDGEEIGELSRPPDTHIYGLGWFPEDEDEYYLYVFTNDGEYRKQVHKVNPATDENMFLRDLPDVEGARAGGLAISGTWDPYSWVFMSMLDSPDIVGIWQLAPRTDWLAVDQDAGEIEAGGSTDLTITLNTEGLVDETVYEASLVFTHDGVGGSTEVLISLEVTGEGGLVRRVLHFELGWNMVSLNIQPVPDDIIEIMRPLVEEDLLILMKDSEGRFYMPEWGYNDIPRWEPLEGYQVKVMRECDLAVIGEPLPENAPIQLFEGWQIVAYLPRQAVDAEIALGGIVDHLILAKDGFGNFYNPEFGFNGIGDMVEGQGYQIKVDQDIELIYNPGDQAYSAASPPTPLHFGPVNPTGSCMSLLAVADRRSAGSEIGIYNAAGLLVGTGMFDACGRCGLAVWGDDPTTEVIDGAIEGEPVELRLWQESEAGKNGQEILPEYEVIESDCMDGGRLLYQSDGWTVLEISDNDCIPSEFAIETVYPNPFNAMTVIGYGLPVQGHVSLKVYNLVGQQVASLFDGRSDAGRYSVTWDAAGVPSGTYFCRMEAGQHISNVKLVLVR